MATLILVIVVALVALAYVAVPLLVPDQADPLPDFSDPVVQDLTEERDALFRAIKEVEERTDLPDERRQALVARYEAKAAHVLEALDAREAELAGRPPAREPRRRRVPYGAVALAALVVIAAAVMPSFVLPRVGRNATVTSTDTTVARQIEKLKRAADKQPTAQNLMALGDAYWNAQEADKAVAAYQQVVDTITPVPAAVYKRLAAVYLQSDLGKAYGYLQKALNVSPNDAETLYAMGQVAFAQGSLAEAKRAFERYLATPGHADDAQAKQQIAEIDAVQPLEEKAKQDPSESNLMALANAYWAQGDKNRAVNVYIQVLTGPDVHNPVALSRTGQVLFTSGRSADAISLITRAGEAAGGLDKLDLPSLLMLGNAYFSQQQYQHAIDTWNLYVRKAGGPAKAGRVPDLIASAEAREAAAGAAAGGGTTNGPTPAAGANGAAGGTATGATPGAATPGAGATGAGATGAGMNGAGMNGGGMNGAGMAGAPMAGGVGNAVGGGAAAASTSAGQQLFLANCATCHGAAGQGGAGPALAGNGRAANAGNVRDAIRYGRGVMPGFQARLSSDQITALVDYVTKVLAPKGR